MGYISRVTEEWFHREHRLNKSIRGMFGLIKRQAMMRLLEMICKVYLDNSGKYGSVGSVGLECRESHNSGSAK